MLQYLATLRYNNSKTVKSQSKTTAIMDYLGEKLLPTKYQVITILFKKLWFVKNRKKLL